MLGSLRPPQREGGQGKKIPLAVAGSYLESVDLQVVSGGRTMNYGGRRVRDVSPSACLGEGADGQGVGMQMVSEGNEEVNEGGGSGEHIEPIHINEGTLRNPK